MSKSDEATDPLDLHLPSGRVVPAAQLAWRATTSGGPGGQHANRTASRVEVTVHIADLPLTPHEVKRLYEQLASRITGAGDLTAGAADTRDQHRNRRIAVNRLEKLIADGLHVHKRRIPTRETYGAKLRRRSGKQQAAQKKGSRRWRWENDE
ncbi:MAG: alternative ribosome rescue aminoacyl-tRNA hydrolase ArfB [Gaiellales bacterium]